MSGSYLVLRSTNKLRQTNFADIAENVFWNNGEAKELKRHRIHAYPAKFPAFITTKALDYARTQNVNVQRVADIFCGCGTVAFEAKRNNIDFWGCDINPVATLIAKAKSLAYSEVRLNEYADQILDLYPNASAKLDISKGARARLNYWYLPKQFNQLAKLRNAIYEVIPERSHYRTFFLCAFSNILKPTSRWLTKSIKPQIDPIKVPGDVRNSFVDQLKNMIDAVAECEIEGDAATEIVNANFLTLKPIDSRIDMIITSPPYVTSYEYADLHQLSSLWLGYTDDYKLLRNGSIGSSQHDFNFSKEVKQLNESGTGIVFNLFARDKAIARSTAKYFLDMQNVSTKCFEFLEEGGLALFVIGNTEYMGVKIDNAKHLAESLLSSGFRNVRVTKRRISNKFLTPNRDSKGKFSRSSVGKQIYGEEYILIAKK